MSKKKILVTGGDGRFAKVLKKNNSKLDLYFASKKECDILNENSIINIFKKSINLNIIGTANLVKICSQFKVKIIYFSTGYVYEGKFGNYKETNPVKPFNNYGFSKLGGECSVSMYDNHLILRITMTEKPFTHKSAYSNLISNYIYHEDLVKLLPKIINQKGILNIGGKSQSVYDFAKSKNLYLKKIKAKKNSNLPLRQDMNINKLNKIKKNY